MDTENHRLLLTSSPAYNSFLKTTENYTLQIQRKYQVLFVYHVHESPRVRETPIPTSPSSTSSSPTSSSSIASSPKSPSLKSRVLLPTSHVPRPTSHVPRPTSHVLESQVPSSKSYVLEFQVLRPRVPSPTSPSSKSYVPEFHVPVSKSPSHFKSQPCYRATKYIPC